MMFAFLKLPSPASADTTPRRHSLGRMMDSSTMLLLVAIATLIIVLALLILFHHNLNATKGYTLRSLEFVRTELMNEQEVLNMDLAKSQALESIVTDPQITAMLKPVKFKYVRGDLPLAKGIADRLLMAPTN